MTVLVTGGTGFVAGWCIAGLLDRGYTVRTTVRDLGRAPHVLAQFPGSDGRLEVVAADLTADAGWREAMADLEVVLHVASPMGGGDHTDADALIIPARDGARRIIAAAATSGVPRVVMTSSGAAATPPPGATGEFDESLWTNPDQPGLDAYRRSKAIAERAAWDELAAHPGPTTLTTILPGAIFGPLRSPEARSSAQVIAQLMRPGPGLPRVGLQIVDVRDLADLHIAAMENPAAAGKRFLAVAGNLWMREVAELIRDDDPMRKVTTRELPDWLVRLAARFQPELTQLVPMLGRRYTYSTAAARTILGWHPRPVEETVLDTVVSLRTFDLA